MAPRKTAPPRPVIVTIAGMEIDFSKTVPMLAGDWTALKRQGVKLGPNHNILDDPDAMVTFVLWFAQKVNGGLTREMLLEVPVTKVIAAALYIHTMSSEDITDPN